MISEEQLKEWEAEAKKILSTDEVDDSNLIAPRIFFKKDSKRILVLIEEVQRLQLEEKDWKIVAKAEHDRCEMKGELIAKLCIELGDIAMSDCSESVKRIADNALALAEKSG